MEEFYNIIQYAMRKKIIIDDELTNEILKNLIKIYELDKYVNSITIEEKNCRSWGYYNIDNKQIVVNPYLIYLNYCNFDSDIINLHIMQTCIHEIWHANQQKIVTEKTNTFLGKILQLDNDFRESKKILINTEQLPCERNAELHSYITIMGYFKYINNPEAFNYTYKIYADIALKNYKFNFKKKKLLCPLEKSCTYFKIPNKFKELFITNNLSTSQKIYYGLPVSNDEYNKVKKLIK